jgi:hypothetical protein
MLVAVALCERRVHRSGRAFCLLGPRWSRVIVASAALVVAAAAASVLSPALSLLALAVLSMPSVPAAVQGFRALPAKARLRAGAPRARHVYVHSVASTLPGAGAELLSALVQEADEQAWSLALDASNERLARYYEGFGFAATGGPVTMPDGSRHTRMWRSPLPVRRP